MRRGGLLVVLVPDEDMYEQCVWPSTFNNDHKHTFTICQKKTWSPVSRNLTDLCALVADLAEPVRIEQLHATFQRGIGRVDQTETPVGERAIEFVLRKL